MAWKQASLHLPSLSSSVIGFTHFNIIPVKMGQPIKGDSMLIYTCTYLGMLQKKKKNMTAIRYVNNMIRQTDSVVL